MIQVTHYSIELGSWIECNERVVTFDALEDLRDRFKKRLNNPVLFIYKIIELGDDGLVKETEKMNRRPSHSGRKYNIPKEKDMRVNQFGTPIIKNRLGFYDNLTEERKVKYKALYNLVFTQNALENGTSLKEAGSQVGLSYASTLTYFSHMLKSKGYKL